MQKDFKIGLFVGILAAVAAIIWLGTRPKLATEERALNAASTPAPAASPEIQQPIQPAQPIQTAKPVQAAQTARFHIVQKGDTLSAISQKYYGTPRYWQKILAANDAIIKDPDRLIPGSRLLIPD